MDSRRFVDPEKEQSQKRQDALTKLKSDALRLLAARPRSIAELRERLEKKGHDKDSIERAVEGFCRQGLLNDEKFAKLLAGATVHNRPVGKKRLEAELKKKGLAPEIVRQTVDDLDDYDPKQAAKDLARRRFERMSGLADRQKKARLFGFLRRRGFEQDLIFSVLDELFKEAATAPDAL